MSARSQREALERRLSLPPADGVFSEGELVGVPEPARRYLRRAIALGTPLARSARIQMRGRIKLGSRWVRFSAQEVLAPHVGFLWWGRAGGLISGFDHYADGEGGLHWKLLGLVTVAHAEGPDVARSAAARAAGEGLWLPTALLPRFGVEWEGGDASHAVARYRIGDLDFVLHCTIDESGRLLAAAFDRWGDPDGGADFGWHRFGMTLTREATFGGLTVPAAGKVGWHHGTERWAEGEFFRYLLDDVTPVP